MELNTELLGGQTQPEVQDFQVEKMVLPWEQMLLKKWEWHVGQNFEHLV